MSLCSYSISKPSLPNHHISSRWPPNPKIKPLQFFKFEAFCRNLSSCLLVKAVHADGVGVVCPDNTVSDRNASFEVEPEDEVHGVVNGVPGTDTEEAYEVNTEIRLKKSGDLDENDVNSRFKLRNGREVFEERAYIVGMARKGDDTDGSFGIEESLSELEQLADTAGLAVVGSTYQKLATPNSRTYIGSGKVAEIKSAIHAFDVETVIFDDELSPGQLRNLEKAFGGDVRVCDRTALILDIFNQRAATREASLQVSLAQMEYQLPRLTRMWTHLERQAGGQVKGMGEKQIEVDKRILRDQCMRRTHSLDSLLFDPEIERTARRLRKERREQLKQMAENRENERNNEARPALVPIRDHFKPVLNANYSGIARQTVTANNFELKPALISMVQQNQFGGSALEDPHLHLRTFLEIADTVKIHGASDDVVKLRLFPFSLRDQARSWLQSLPLGSITTWVDLATKFLSKYFPPAKSAQLRIEISTFRQLDQESLYEAWERFKDLLRRCPGHDFKDHIQIELFYNGLNGPTRMSVDAAAGGTIFAKDPVEAYELLDQMALNSYQWPSERSTMRKTAGMYEIDHFTSLSAQLSALTTQVAALSKKDSQMQGEITAAAVGMPMTGGGPNMEEAQYMNNRNYVNYRGNQAPNQYHPGNRNHENFSYANNKNVLNPPPGFNTQRGEGKPTLEDLVSTFVSESSKRFERNESRLDNIETHMTNMGASMKSLEVQIGQLAGAMNNQQKGVFPSNTEVNPKEQCKAVTLRNGKELEDAKPVDRDEKRIVEEAGVELKQPQEVEENDKTIQPVKPEVPKANLPYPQRFKKKALDGQYAKFLDIFKKLHINIPFADALEQMPNYAKFLKDVMSRKKKLGEFETVNLTEECSAIIQKKIPQKLKDPGSFTIPCIIGGSNFHGALCDLGASINLMPLNVFRRLGLGEVKPTTMTLQLADRSIKYPRGVIEDVLIKVDRFIFPADFVVLDMECDQNVPLILGRPFLATGRALIDVHKGELTLRVDEEEVMFKIYRTLQYHENEGTCKSIDFIDSCVNNFSAGSIPIDSLEKCLVNSIVQVEDDDWDLREQILALESLPEEADAEADEELPDAAAVDIPKAKPDLKELPDHLCYAFLGDNSTHPIAALKKEIESVRKHRKQYRNRRFAVPVPVVSLVGYTNAGKSTLLNRLTGADVLTEDKLFATLDPTTRRVQMKNGKEFLLTDTVGFIQKLPTTLVAAFRATLEEISESSLLVHVVDISHPLAELQIEAVDKVLSELEASSIPKLMVWNKVDNAKDPEKIKSEAKRYVDVVCISALTGEGLGDFINAVQEKLKDMMVWVEALIPFDKGELLSTIHRVGMVEKTEYVENGALVRAHVPLRFARLLTPLRQTWVS